MAILNSVLGPFDSADLGFTLMHEHIISRAAGITQNYPELFDTGFMQNAVQSLTRAKENGIDSIVDATTMDLGRDVTALAHISRLSGVNIIACTGWFL